MRPDDGRVDHLHHFADAIDIVDRFQENIPQARQRPAPELAVDRRPFSKDLRQIPPLGAGAGDPEDPVQHTSVVPGRAPAAWAPDHHEGLEERPFLIPHQSTDQGVPPLGSKY